MKRLFPIVMHAVLTIGLIGVLASGCSDDDGGTTPQPPVTNDTTVKEMIRPILFVHGAYEAADVWIRMGKWFINNDHAADQVYAIDLIRYMDDGTPSAQIMGTQIDTKMKEILAATSADRVDIIAHGKGVQGVQYYLTRLEGTKSAAHVVYVAGQFDMSLTLNGSVTPNPCKYMTITSDGMDATQNGNASAGTLSGITNNVISGKDHLQLLNVGESFSKIYQFLVGKAPLKTDQLPRSIGTQHTVRGRILSYLDNEPVVGAKITLYDCAWTTNGFGRQSPPLTGTTANIVTDANGYFSLPPIVNGREMEMKVEHAEYYQTRMYIEPYQSYDVPFERAFMIPRPAKGSALLQSFTNGLKPATNHSIVIARSIGHTLYSNRDVVRAIQHIEHQNPDIPAQDSLSITTPAVMPPPGSPTTPSNVSTLVLFDENQDKANGSGPMNIPAFNGYSISSYDLFFSAEVTQLTSALEINGKRLYFQNARSSGSGTTNAHQGIVWLRFDSHQ